MPSAAEFDDHRTVYSQPDRHYGTATAVSEKPSPVLSEYGFLSQELSRLHETFDILRRKLDPIVGPAMPEPGGEAEQAKIQPLSPFAESIRSDSGALRRLRYDMETLINRLEV